MDDQKQSEWCNAPDAIELLLQIYGMGQGYTAAKALASRAHSGLVKTRARLFKWQEQVVGLPSAGKVSKEATDAELPRKFWWAEGEAALTQNWVSGDFSTWIDGRYQYQAFGVEFSRLDVEAMLPASSLERRSASAAITQPENERGAPLNHALPSDTAIETKMLELIGLGVSRDVAAKVIRQVAGFEGVGNEHARRLVAGKLPRGRPKKEA